MMGEWALISCSRWFHFHKTRESALPPLLEHCWRHFIFYFDVKHLVDMRQELIFSSAGVARRLAWVVVDMRFAS